MNHKTKVNTSPGIEQAENITLPLLQINAVRQQLGDIEEQALSAKTICEIAFDELDAVSSSEPAVVRMILRLDALIKAAYRSAASIQELVEQAGGALLESQVAA